MALQAIKLNKDEMASYKWVSTLELMNARNICWVDYSERLKGVLRFLNYNFVEDGEDSSSVDNNPHEGFPLDCVSRALSSALDVGMSQRLYGVTMYIMLIVLRGVLERL